MTAHCCEGLVQRGLVRGVFNLASLDRCCLSSTMISCRLARRMSHSHLPRALGRTMGPWCPFPGTVRPQYRRTTPSCLDRTTTRQRSSGGAEEKGQRLL
jgi:hypothetical protein